MLNETEWYKFRLKYKQIKGENLSKDFNKYLDDFETGLEGKKIRNFELETTLGTHFDDVISNKLVNGKLEDVTGLKPKLKEITQSDNYVFDKQVNLKMEPAFDKPTAIPDNLAFSRNAYGTVNYTEAYWVECKIDKINTPR